MWWFFSYLASDVALPFHLVILLSINLLVTLHRKQKTCCLQSKTGLYWIILQYYHIVSLVGEEI